MLIRFFQFIFIELWLIAFTIYDEYFVPPKRVHISGWEFHALFLARGGRWGGGEFRPLTPLEHVPRSFNLSSFAVLYQETKSAPN